MKLTDPEIEAFAKRLAQNGLGPRRGDEIAELLDGDVVRIGPPNSRGGLYMPLQTYNELRAEIEREEIA